MLRTCGSNWLLAPMQTSCPRALNASRWSETQQISERAQRHDQHLHVGAPQIDDPVCPAGAA